MSNLTMMESLDQLPQFSASLLDITLKLGGISKLRFKQLQYRIHIALKRLMAERKEVRLVIVKPRQIRSSTYCQALIFEQMYHFEGTQALTVTHRGAITDELFTVIKRFQDRMPEEVKIPAKKDNEDLLYLANESKAKVATAGSDAARGYPCKILQLSELGRCTAKQTKDIQEGAMQTLATGDGSICIIESTSGGGQTYFHEIAKQGLVPKERWKTLFFGFQEEPEYVLEPPIDWEPEGEDKDIADAFNLTREQSYWRHSKLKSEFFGSTVAFNREYPATFDMAFEAASGRLINYMAILKARKSQLLRNPAFPIIMGVDPAGKGDRTVITIRQGLVVPKHYVFRNMDDATLTGIIGRLMDEWQVKTCFMDMGYGHGTVAHLRDLGRYNVIGVHFGARATAPHLYTNKRTEMAAAVRDWLQEGVGEEGGLVRIPDDDEFCDDLKAIPELEYSGSKGLFYLKSKDEIKDDLQGKSPDCFDSLCLTFAFPVRADNAGRLIVPAGYESRGSGLLQTENTFAQLQNDNQGDNIRTNPNFKFYSYGD